MKYILTVAVLIVLVVYTVQEIPPEIKQQLSKTAQKCMKETNVSPEQLKKMQTGETVDQSVKCFTKCFMMDLGTMDANGQVNFEKLIEYMPAGEKREKFTPVVEKCKGEKGVDACETAFAVQQCVGKARMEILNA